MNNYLLDAGGLLLFAYVLIGLFMVLAIVAEMITMIAMRYHPGTKKAFNDSLLANLASFVTGLVVIKGLSYYPDGGMLVRLLIFYLITIVVEGFVLYLLHKDKPLAATIKICLVMNLFS
jgi:hypothetical protein